MVTRRLDDQGLAIRIGAVLQEEAIILRGRVGFHALEEFEKLAFERIDLLGGPEMVMLANHELPLINAPVDHRAG